MRIAIAALTAGLAFAFAGAAAAAEAPFSFDATPGRLAKTVVPSAYTIALVPDVRAHTFRGRETVVLTVTKPAATLTLNTLDLTIASATIDGRPARVRTDNAAQLSTLTPAGPLAPGAHTLALAYRGTIARAAQGLFYQPYRGPDGSQKELLGTQMEATDARRMFPSWDEPAFRATYQLTVTLPANFTAVSNTPVASTVAHGGERTTTFARTPKMASYLVVLCAGELESISDRVDGVTIDVFTTRGKAETGRYALEAAKQILAYYDDYFGVRYPLPKLDLIAIPGGFGGAMENWGGMTYNESVLLVDPRTSGLERRQRVFAVVAHEMAHQWFGDLVTMAWWNDLWLNEGFASWMGTKATDHLNPSWHVWQAAADGKARAMVADARLSTHPIQARVDNETQAAAAFDQITYLKGQAFLRMLEAYLGPDPFRAGIRDYVAAHAYANATTADLWAALASASGKPVADIARGWTEQPGYPVVTVSASCNPDGTRQILLAQKRFLTGGTDPNDELWEIPIRIETEGAQEKYAFMPGRTASVAGGLCGTGHPISVNDDNLGFYRVQYDQPTQTANETYLMKLGSDERIEALGDAWALTQSGAQSPSAYLGLAAHVTDANAVEWGDIATTFRSMADLERGTAGEAKFNGYAASVLRPVFERVGWDAKPGEDVTTQQLRRSMIAALGRYDDKAIVAEAQRRFAAFLTDPASLSPDDQRVVLEIAARNADQTTFDRIHALARNATSLEEKQRYYGALALVKNDGLAAQALQTFGSSEMPSELASSRVRLVGAVAGAGHAKLAWDYYKAHATMLLSSLSNAERVMSIANTLDAFSDAAPSAELANFSRRLLPADAGPALARALDRVQQHAELRARVGPQLDAALATQSGFQNMGAGPEPTPK